MNYDRVSITVDDDEELQPIVIIQQQRGLDLKHKILYTCLGVFLTAKVFVVCWIFTLSFPASAMLRPLPMLCECQRLEGCVEHRDMYSSYILWVMHHDASHVVFLHKRWLNALVYTDGQTFLQLLSRLPPEDCCKMISRTLLGALKYKPDYIIIVSDNDSGAPLASGLSMDTALGLAQPDLSCIRAIAEGPMGSNNFLGQRLSELCKVLADRGFFEDPKNRRFLSKVVA